MCNDCLDLVWDDIYSCIFCGEPVVYCIPCDYDHHLDFMKYECIWETNWREE
jgi:hypothetical protein